MIAEFQFSAASLLAMIRSRLQFVPVCLTAQFADPFAPKDAAPVSLVVDHVEFAEPVAQPIRVQKGSLTWVRYSPYLSDQFWVSPTQRVQIGQPFHVFLQDVGKLTVSIPTEFTRSPLLTLWIEISFEVATDGSAALKFRLADLTDVGGVLASKPDLRDLMLARLAAISLPPVALDLSPLKTIAPGLTPLHGGVATSLDEKFSASDGDFLAFRIELGPAKDYFYSPAPTDVKNRAFEGWERFYGGHVEKFLPSSDWSFFIEGGLLAKVTAQKLSAELYKVPNLIMTDDPVAEWAESVDPAMLTIHAPIVLSGACTDLDGDGRSPSVDIDATVTFDVVDLTAPEDLEPDPHKAVQLRTRVTRDMDNDDAFMCELTGAVLLGLTFAVLAAGGGPAAVAIAGAIWFFCGFALTATIMAETPIPFSEPDCIRVKFPGLLDPVEEFVCTVRLPSVIGGADFFLSRRVSRPGGLCFAGGIVPPRFLRAAVMEVDTPIFGVSVKDLCRPGTRVVYEALVPIRRVHDPDAVPLYLCDVVVDPKDDPVGQFRDFKLKYVVDSDPAFPEVPHGKPARADEQVLIISVPLALEPEYEKNPYDCVLTLKSTGGARRVTIPKIKPLTEEERVELARAINFQKLACPTIAAPFWEGKKLRPKWAGGDPPFDLPAVRLWEFLITGLGPGESISLDHDDLGRIATATATARGAAYLTTLTSAAEERGGLSLARAGGAMLGSFASGDAIPEIERTMPSNATPQTQPSATVDGRYVYLRQTLLVRESVVRLRDRCSYLAAGRIDGADALLVVHELGVNVYAVAVPSVPTLRYQSLIPGLHGASARQDRILAWGRSGLWLLSPEPTAADQASSMISAAPVLDIAHFGSWTYELTEEGINVLDGNLQRQGTVPLEGARSLEVSASCLVVNAAQGLELYDLTEPHRPESVGRYPLQGVAELLRPDLVDGRRAVCLGLAGGGAVVLQLSSPQEPREILRFENAPWFDATVRLRRLRAHLDKGRSELSLYVSHGVSTRLQS